MRIMSDAREAAWGVLQAVLSELDFDFHAYARRHFERLLEAAGRAQLRGVAFRCRGRVSSLIALGS